LLTSIGSSPAHGSNRNASNKILHSPGFCKKFDHNFRVSVFALLVDETIHSFTQNFVSGEIHESFIFLLCFKF
jgi:hypothetical protein